MRISDWSSDVCSSDLSQRVRITNYDTSKGAAAAARQALADGNKLIIGPLLSENVKIVSPIARNAGVPVITFSNDVSVAGGGTYVLGYSPAQSIDRVVDYAHPRGVTPSARLNPLEIGRASCRERVCKPVEITVVDVSLKKQTDQKN